MNADRMPMVYGSFFIKKQKNTNRDLIFFCKRYNIIDIKISCQEGQSMARVENAPLSISKQTLQRLPIYLEFLHKYKIAGNVNVSSAVMAQALSLHPVQVRKDLASVSTVDGNPRIGFGLGTLIRDIEDFLGYNNLTDAVLAGAGNLGRALLSYKTFEQCGIQILAGFDSDPAKIGSSVHGKEILDFAKLTDMCRRFGVHIGIITVPADSAQSVCDMMVAGGVLAIWNFAPVKLSLPEGILVHNENLTASLSALSSMLRQRMSVEK